MSESAFDREIASLRRRLKKEREDHKKTIAAKNRALELARQGDVLFVIGEDFPELRNMIDLLARCSLYASPLRSPTGGRRSASVTTPLEMGATTSGDRARVEWINREMAKLIDKVRHSLQERGHLEDKGPVCWEADCPARGWTQSFDAEERGECITCRTPFGTTRYKPTDLTQIKVRLRCWKRGCPKYGWRFDDTCPGCGSTPATGPVAPESPGA